MMMSNHSISDLKLRGTVLSSDPLVLYTGAYAARQEPNEFSILQNELGNVNVTWLVLVAWSAEPGSLSAKNIVEWRRQRLDSFPKHRIIFMANTKHEESNLKALGAEAFLLSQNAFVDRDLFKPTKEVTGSDYVRPYLAIYNAQFLDFKRHELCANIPQNRLALIGYNFETPCFNNVKTLLPDAHYLNLASDGSTRWLTQARVNSVYNQASVGLCLSRVEGAMHASMEYLLSGLPIVTTLSKGGRDYFFDGRYVRWCNDDPSSIVDSVQELASECIPPSFIRSQTLAKIDHYVAERLPLLANILGISDSKLKSDLELCFNDKLITPTPISKILAQINGC